MSAVSEGAVPALWRDRYTRLSQGAWERLWAIPVLGERFAASERAAVPDRPCRVLFLCKGNICRSAYAVLAASRMTEGRPGWEFRSAGLEARPGSRSPDPAIRAAAAMGIDLASHRSRLVSPSDVLEADAVLVMEPHQKGDARRAGLRAPVALLGAFGGAPVPVLHDPYGRSDADYRRCFARIEGALAALVARPEGARLPGASAAGRPDRSLP